MRLNHIKLIEKFEPSLLLKYLNHQTDYTKYIGFSSITLSDLPNLINQIIKLILSCNV